MLLYVFATFCVGLAASYSIVDNDFLVQYSDSELYWTDTFSVKVTKLSLTSNLIENFKAWKNTKSSRIDYNDGSVILITTPSKKYEIHPETTDGEEPITVCNVIINTDSNEFSVDSILPSTGWFVEVGNETINDKETVIFEYTYKSEEQESREVIWAEDALYDEGDSVWIPVRYEKKTYNSVLGALTTHEIWDFSEFYESFDTDVFDASDYGCTEEKAVKHSTDSDKVIKELMFIDPDNQKHIDHVFNKYIASFEREYAREEEHIMRRAIFNENMRMVRTVNRQNAGYKLAINHFSDRTPQELESSRGLKMRVPGQTGNIEFPYNEAQLEKIVHKIPKEYDLRQLDVISSVLQQAECGSCWAFAATAAVEGALARVNGGKRMNLAVQALIDCVWPFGSNGCGGGYDTAAYNWMMEYGLPTEEEYGPYKNKDDFCRIANMSQLYPIRGYTLVTPFSNEATKVALFKHGPLSVSIHVTRQFQQYSSGIFYQKDCNPMRLNHEVAMVGYGEKHGKLYWILKNSWGLDWGVDGYMLIAAKDNTCGTTNRPSYVSF